MPALPQSALLQLPKIWDAPPKRLPILQNVLNSTV
jgi:hypothetical protein